MMRAAAALVALVHWCDCQDADLVRKYTTTPARRKPRLEVLGRPALADRRARGTRPFPGGDERRRKRAAPPAAANGSEAFFPSVAKAERLVRALVTAAALDEPADDERTHGVFPSEVNEHFLKKIRKQNPKLPAETLAEAHHSQYGGAWMKGRDQFETLVNRGLRPHHTFLELGCGSLRAAIYVIEFLDAGNYYCLEEDRASLRAGITYELRLHGLLAKRPRLLASRTFDLPALVSRSRAPADLRFDFSYEFSVLMHICRGCRDAVCVAGLHAAASRLKPGGAFVTNKRLSPAIDLARFGLEVDGPCVRPDSHFLASREASCAYRRTDAPLAPLDASWWTAKSPDAGHECFVPGAQPPRPYTIGDAEGRAAWLAALSWEWTRILGRNTTFNDGALDGRPAGTKTGAS